MNKLHHASGHNFHGQWAITLRGPAEGFALSPGQMRKVRRALCPYSDCKCGGGYGDGLDSGSAIIEESDYDAMWLTPA